MMSAQKPLSDHPQCPLPAPVSTASFWHTEPSPLLLGHRSTRQLPEKADVVVIGSGITGASVAWHLLGGESGTVDGGKGNEDGPSVVMLEAREACWGATGRNGGHCHPMIYEHPSDPSVGHFELANFTAIENLITTLSIPAAEFTVQHGVRGLYDPTELADAAQNLRILAQHDESLASHVHLVTDKKLLSEELRLPTALGAVVTDTAARMWPYKFVARVLEELITSTDVRGRFNLQTHTPVLSLDKSTTTTTTAETEYGWSVHTERGDVLAKKVVLATNAYTSHLLPQFADLIVPCRGQMSALMPPVTAAGENRLKTSYGFMGKHQDDYLVQRPSESGGHLMFGGGRQHDPSTIGNADDSVINQDLARYLRSELNELLGLGEKGEELEAVKEWTGVMGFSRDNHPWAGPVPDSPGLFISAGYTGHGMPNAWLCGKAVARMAGPSSERVSIEQVVEEAIADTGLPRSYLPTGSRQVEARRLATVAELDHANMFKAEKTK